MPLYEYQSEQSYNSEVKYLYFGLWDILIFMFPGNGLYKSEY
jgi:hypothetical protein